jgi:hypothetical protein
VLVLALWSSRSLARGAAASDVGEAWSGQGELAGVGEAWSGQGELAGVGEAPRESRAPDIAPREPGPASADAAAAPAPDRCAMASASAWCRPAGDGEGVRRGGRGGLHRLRGDNRAGVVWLYPCLTSSSNAEHELKTKRRPRRLAACGGQSCESRARDEGIRSWKEIDWRINF